VRRLYSTFAQGPPGIGLLLIRLVAGGTAIVIAVGGFRSGPPLAAALLQVLCIALGSLLVIGLWTPFGGTLLALTALWSAFAYPQYRWGCVVIGTLGAALALVGPGMWSVDARLFGWKRLEIRGHPQRQPPPEST
jgi:putative oxidoreductase